MGARSENVSINISIQRTTMRFELDITYSCKSVRSLICSAVGVRKRSYYEDRLCYASRKPRNSGRSFDIEAAENTSASFW
jgi:hypothetical protein